MDRKGTDLNTGARWALHTQGTREPRTEARKWGEKENSMRSCLAVTQKIKGEMRWERASPRAQMGKESACIAGDLGSIPRLGRSPGGGHGNKRT